MVLFASRWNKMRESDFVADSGTPLILSVYTGCTLVLNMVVPNDLKIGFSLLHGTLL